MNKIEKSKEFLKNCCRMNHITTTCYDNICTYSIDAHVCSKKNVWFSVKRCLLNASEQLDLRNVLFITVLINF